MQAAQVGLIGMEIDRAEPLAGDAATGDCLEISGRGIDLDGFFFDQLIAQLGVPEMADGFLAGEENGVLQLAADERGVGFGRFENRTAAGFLGEQDLGDIE